VVNTRTQSVVTTIPVGVGPQLLAVNHQTNRVYVANEGANTVSVLNGTTNSVVTTIPVDAGPVDIAINDETHRAYVTTAFSNTLTVHQHQ